MLSDNIKWIKCVPFTLHLNQILFQDKHCKLNPSKANVAITTITEENMFTINHTRIYFYYTTN